MAPPTFSPLRARRIVASELPSLPPLRLARWDGGIAPLATEVRLGHDGQRLLVEFRARHRGVDLDADQPTDRPTPRLWLRDVVEVFVSDDSRGAPYRELEVSPLGQWLALAFDAPRVASATSWQPTPEIRAQLDADTYRVALAIPFDQLCTRPERRGEWRIGLFRIGGREPSREYSSYEAAVSAGPTGPAPDFHQPDCWTPLVLDELTA